MRISTGKKISVNSREPRNRVPPAKLTNHESLVNR